MTPPTAAELDSYRAQTDRLLKLSEFAWRMAPALGQTTAAGFDRGELLDDLAKGSGVVEARDAAIVATLNAIAGIARQSS